MTNLNTDETYDYLEIDRNSIRKNFTQSMVTEPTNDRKNPEEEYFRLVI
jgi:hypothetical protein